MSWLAPGLGWAYLGVPRRALAIHVVGLSLWSGFVAAWLVLDFHPSLPGPVVGLFLVWIQFMLAMDASSFARRFGAFHALRPANHPVVYVALAVLSWWLPLGLLAGGAQWARPLVPVVDASMYPTLLPGDRVVVRRWPSATLLPGQVVAYLPPGATTASFARLVAVAGDEVVLVGDQPYVNDAPLAQAPPSETDLQRLARFAGPSDGEGVTRVEQGHGVAYAVQVSPSAVFEQPTPITVAPGQAYLLHDARGDLQDSRSFGTIEIDRILGPASYVSYSVDGNGDDASMHWLDWIGAAPRAVVLLVAKGELPGLRALRTARRVQPVAPRTAAREGA